MYLDSILKKSMIIKCAAGEILLILTFIVSNTGHPPMTHHFFELCRGGMLYHISIKTISNGSNYHVNTPQKSMENMG